MALTVLDSHALVYSADKARYPFAADAAPLQPDELEACTETAALDAALASGALSNAVLVQRGRFYGFDNALVCDLAARDERLRALVSVDGREARGVSEARRLLALPDAAGVRLMEPAKGASLDWLAGENARGVWAAAAEAEAVVDVHLFPWIREEGLALLAGLVREFSSLRVVLDNLGGAAVESGAPDFGLDAALAPLLAAPQVSFKFSEMTLGRIERAGLDAADAIGAVARQVGAEQLAWGSDVLPAERPLAEAAARAAAAVEGLSEAERQAVLCGNAARLFGFA